MKCYRCNSELSENNFCNSCGADVAVYKKVVRLSNSYYNMGLAKAQIRDLTGASDLLRRSVRFDKRNTNARNLLGLVYYEMGEAVQAFSEWVISKNIQPEKNIADDYIKRLQSNPVRLDTINQTIKKYNLALNYAKQSNDDVAVIQLKKVLNTNPNLVKGHLLLALLYMKKGEFEKARKPIIKTLKLDTSNPLAKRYLNAIDKELGIKKSDKDKTNLKKSSSDFSDNKNEKEFLKNYDINIPRSGGYKESKSGMFTVINVIIGLVVGVATAYFLLIPAKENALEASHKKEIKSIYSQMDTLNSEKNDLQNQITTLQGEKDNLTGQLTTKGSESETIMNDYNNLVSAMLAFDGSDFIKCASYLKNITKSDYSTDFQAQYDTMKNESYKQAATKSYQTGKNESSSASSIEEYAQAIKDLTDCFSYDFMSTNYVDAADALGTAYEKQYELALTQDATSAATYKEAALTNMAALIENVLNKTENIDPSAAEKLQQHIVTITDKQ